MNRQDRQKQLAAAAAVEQVQSGMVVGLGTGSTAAFAIRQLGEKIRKGALKNVLGVPSSLATEKLAREVGIPLTSLQKHPRLDLTIDGADEVDERLNLIKGGGGALLREKILAQNSVRLVIVVDEGKRSSRLGERFQVPVEVLPFGWLPEKQFLESLGAQVSLRTTEDGTPFQTDQHNYILDCWFGPIDDVLELNARMHERAGILEHGLFIGLASQVLVGTDNGVEILNR